MTPSTETQTEITKLTLGNDTNLHTNPRKTESVQVTIVLPSVLTGLFIVIAVFAAVMCRRWIKTRGTATICCGPNEENLTEYLVKLETV
jgi:tellurite resistance protein TehA-like permease